MLVSSRPPRTRWTQRIGIGCFLCVLGVPSGDRVAIAQEPAAPPAISEADFRAAIDKLGSLDYATRTKASRTIRRTPGSQAVPALLRAVSEHADGYVRYRALVLLTGFNDRRTAEAMRESLASPNDRMRTAAYSYFEHNPDPAMTSVLLASLGKEEAEFVRPALVRALAAVGDDPRVSPVLAREAGRGEDFFRSAVIEALGDYKARYALDALLSVAKLDGPLLDDTALALGKIGDERALATLASLQQTAPRSAQPLIAAAICLLGVKCDSHEVYLGETLKFAAENGGAQDLGRGAAAGLAALAVAGRSVAADALFALGIAARDPIRAPIALAVGKVALRNTDLTLSLLEKRPQPADALALLAEGFDMLEEDLDKERFFAIVRRTYWNAPEGSPTRSLMQTLIVTLDF